MSQKNRSYPNITFLLGAGASYNSLPIVKEIQNEAFVMIQYVEQYAKHFTQNSITFNKTNDLIRQIGKHYSVDTLARKLYLKSKGNSENEDYVRIKNIITCLIIFGQIEEYKKGKVELPKILESRTAKVFKLDPRYDALLAAILNSEFCLPQNVNFVSWNYDFQIEKALKFYYDKDSIWGIGNDRLGIDYMDDKCIPSQIAKVNGTAVFIKGLDVNIDYSVYNNSLHELFIRALSDGMDSTLISGIKFAWEPSELAQKKRELASSIIQNSKFVVAIGYSFPIFNRNRDIDMFKSFKGEIVIQDIDGRAQDVQNQLDAIKPGLLKKSRIITNTDNFFIPSEYWTGKIPGPKSMAI